MEIPKEWLEYLLPLIIFVGLFLFRYITQFTRGRRLKEIAPYINGEAVIWPLVPPKIKGVYMGTPYQMVFLPSGRNSPGRMQIKVSFDFPFGLEVRPRGGIQGLEQLLLRARVIETGDEDFDASTLARSDREKEKAELYLDNPENRATILELFQEGFETVRFSPKEVVLTKQGDFLGGSLTAEQVLHDLSLASRLMQRL
jgi:hypothetical protein